MRTIHYHQLLHLSAFLLIAQIAYSQNRSLSFDYITADDGLSDNYVQYVFRDSKDYLWIGTGDYGVNKFNGYTVTAYKEDEDKPGSISNNSIFCIFEDHMHNVWVGTRNGLNLYNSGFDSFTTFYNDPEDNSSLTSNVISDMLMDNDSNLWIATGFDGGLNKWIPQTKNFQRFLIPDNIGDGDINDRNNLTSVKKDSNGIFWVTNRGSGIFSFNPKTGKFKYFKDPTPNLSDQSYKKFCIDHQGTIWLMSYRDGFYCFDPVTGEFKHFDDNHLMNDSDVDVITDIIIEDNDHILLSADQGGIIQFDKTSETFRNFICEDCNTNGLNSQGVRSLYIDKENILWVGTSRGGVNYYNPKKYKFNLIDHDASDQSARLRNTIGWIYEGSKGLIWLGTDGGGLDVYNPNTGTYKNYKHDSSNPFSISGNVIRCIQEDNDHDFWIGTWATGLNRFVPATGKFYSYLPGNGEQSISNNSIWNLKIDHNNNLWIAYFINGIDLFNKTEGVFKSFRADPGTPGSLSHDLVWSIHQDDQRNIWVCTGNGINLYDSLTESFKVYNNFPDNNIRTFCRDLDGKLWAGSLNNGLFLFDMDGNVLSVYNETNGLPDNAIHSITMDNQGDLWITTNNGLSHFNQSTNEFRNYFKNDGLQGNIFFELSALKTRKGEIYIGGYRGFNSFFPDSLADNDFVPNVYLTDFKVFNKSVTYGSADSILNRHISEAHDIVLTRHQSVFSFEFVTINYTNPGNNQYAYFMEGFETEWNYVGSKMDATYTNLDPGEYVFKVKASNNDKVWNEEGTSIKIFIKPAFWQTWYFKFGLFILVVAGALALYYYRVNQINKQRSVLKSLVEKRTSELEKTNELLKKNNVLLEERQRQIEGQSDELQVQNKRLEDQKLELNNLIQELKETQVQLVHSEKMASLGVLTAGVAHEINNPLNFIQGGLYAIESIVKNEKIESETLSAVIEQMSIGITRASSIVKSLNTFSRKGSLEIRPCNIHEIIDNALLILNHEIKYKCDVTKNYSSDNFILLGNEENLHQVFLNVIMNAAQAIDEKGHIIISTRIIDGMLEIIISDTGSGISQEKIKQIFDPFFTTKEPGKGVGLGLSIVYKIIKEHKGVINYSSEENKGTEVKIELPVSF